MTCTPNRLLEAARCFSCIPRGIVGSVKAYLGCQWANNLASYPCGVPSDDILIIGAGDTGANQVYHKNGALWQGVTDSSWSIVFDGTKYLLIHVFGVPPFDRYHSSVDDFPCVWTIGVGTGPAPSGSYQQSLIVGDWISRVLNAGGAQPSDNTISALQIFVSCLDSSGLLPSMLAVNCIVPDSIIAASVPLIHVKGNPVWTTIAPASSLSIDGFQIGLTAEYMDTGFSPLLDFSSDASFGQTCYATQTNALNNTQSWVVSELSTIRNSLNPGTSSNRVTFIAGDSLTLTAPSSGPLVNGRGYISGNRIGNGRSIYVASSAVSHVLVVSDSLAITARQNATFVVPGQNINGTKGGLTNKRFSFVAMHDALTEPQSALFFNCIQAMRISLGGGYV